MLEVRISSRYRTACLVLLIASVQTPREVFAQASPVILERTNPLLEPWRVTRFPELISRGVRCIAEDADGCIWFGLRDGVIRYNGFDWVSFGADHGLPMGPVEALCAGKRRQLVAATKKGLFEFRRGTWKRLFPAHAAIDTTEVMEASDQSLWCASSWGLIKYQPEELSLYSTPAFADIAEELDVFDRIVRLTPDYFPRHRNYYGTDIHVHASTVASIGQDSPARGKLKLGDRITAVNGEEEGVYALLKQPPGRSLQIHVQRGGKEEFVTVVAGESRDSFADPRMNAVMQDSQGRIWVGMSRGGLMMTTDNGATWRKFSKSDGFETDSRSFPLEAPDGRVWVFSAGKDNNTAVYDGGSWTVRHRSTLGGAGFNGSAAATADGTIYLGGLNRLFVYQNRRWTRHDSRDLRLPSEGHRFLVASDGALWVAGFDQAPVRIAVSDHEFRSIQNASHLCTEASGREWFLDRETHRVFLHEAGRTKSFGPEDGIQDKVVGMVAVPGVGVVATGSHEDTAAASTFDGTVWVRQTFPAVAQSLSKSGFTVSGDGKVWIGARGERGDGQVGGIVYGLGNEWEHFTPPDAPLFCTSVIALRDGRTWFSGGFGIDQFDGQEWMRVSDPLIDGIAIHDTAVDSDGTVWAATRSKGVLRCKNAQWRQYDSGHGLPSNEVEEIHVDATNQLWVSTRDGLCRFDGQRFQVVHVPVSWGQDSIASTAAGELWFDRKTRILPDRDAPRVALDRASVQLPPQGHGYVSWKGIDRWNRTPASGLSYSWSIDGGPWSDYIQERGTTLNDLTPGRHSLSVRVRDDSGNVTEASEQVAITVLAPFLHRPWVILTYASLALGLLWQARRLWRRGRDLQQTNRELEDARLTLAHKVEEQTAQFRTLCDCAPIGIFATDPQFNITYINQQMSDLVQRRFTVAESIEVWMKATLHPDDLPEVERALGGAVENRTTFKCSGRLLRPDGSIRWFEATSDPIHRGDVFVGYVGAVDDVTESREATAQLRLANVRLETALDQLKAAQNQAIRQEQLKALGQMAAGVAHDINNALAPLLNYSALLETEIGLSDEARKWTSLIRMGVSDTAKTVQRLDHFYRESHNESLLEVVNLARVVRQTIELTRPRWLDESRSERRQIKMVPRILAEPYVRADASQIRSVLTNLIFNAVDAIAEAGEIVVTVEVADEDTARVSVSDDGCGMTAHQLENCTVPFFTSKQTGSGLGLSESYGIMRQHGGQLNIESIEGQGTTVTLDLRRHPAPADVPSDKPEPVDSPQVEESSAAAPSQSIVLYIDDNEFVRSSTAALLEALGVEVLEAADGPAGLQLMEQQLPQFVLCDHGLPGMDGLTVMRNIRARWPIVPVVMVSGWSLPENEEDETPDAFLAKPFSIADLKEVVRRSAEGELRRPVVKATSVPAE